MLDIVLGILVVVFQCLAGYAGFHVALKPPQQDEPTYQSKIRNGRIAFGLLTGIALCLGATLAWRNYQSGVEVRNQITGGDSFGFAFIVRFGDVKLTRPTMEPLIVTNQGLLYPLRGVRLHISQLNKDKTANLHDYEVGDIAPGQFHLVPMEQGVLIHPNAENYFNIVISANNGTAAEEIYLHPKGDWFTSEYRLNLNGRIVTQIPSDPKHTMIFKPR